jgi:hypothetical protein
MKLNVTIYLAHIFTFGKDAKQVWLNETTVTKSVNIDFISKRKTKNRLLILHRL